jgi:hypothetical protein
VNGDDDNDARACCGLVVDVEEPIVKAVHHIVVDAVPSRNMVVAIAVKGDSLVMLMMLLQNILSL